MKKTRRLALALCIAALLIALTGCGKNASGGLHSGIVTLPGGLAPDESAKATPPQGNGTATPPDNQGNAPDGAGQTGGADDVNIIKADFDAAYNAFAPDTAMVVAGDYTVTWAELYYYLRSNVDYVLSSISVIDWSMVVYEDVTFADFTLEYSIQNALRGKAIEFGADMHSVELSQEALARIDADMEGMIESYGGIEVFNRRLKDEEGIYEYSLLEYFVRNNNLAGAIFDKLYGEGGALFPDEKAAELITDRGYLMAKHILRMKSEEAGDEPLKETEEILRKLESYGGDDLGAYFDELMLEFSEDKGGLGYYPNGYLFQDGDMVQAFYDACVALEIGRFSGIVETSYGYHIILRLPLDYDEIPYSNYSQYDFRPLRQLAAQIEFETVMQGWMDSLTPENTPALEAIDLERLFGNSL